MKKLFVTTYGCQMNVRDSEEVTGLLLGKGYARTEKEEQADVILYNTCSVREHAEHRVWSNVGKLKYLKQERPELVIGVMGCMAKAQREKIFQRMPHVDFISGPSQLRASQGQVLQSHNACCNARPDPGVCVYDLNNALKLSKPRGTPQNGRCIVETKA